MRVLVLGAAGQVGSELLALLPAFAEVVGLTRSELDLEDVGALVRAVDDSKPDVIVNAAAYNGVDGAEREEERACLVNGHAVGALGEAAAKRRSVLLHYSTDFVFDGKADRPYVESDEPAPLSAYGRSKRLGETLLLEQDAPALVFRTSWVYGLRRKSFVRSILQAAREREKLTVVSDQVGCPTAARDLAAATALILYGARRDPFAELSEARGLYHLAGSGHTSRLELARAALALDPRKQEHKAREVAPITTADLRLPATRPVYAPLDCALAQRRFGIKLPPWRDSLARVLSEMSCSA